MSTRKFGSYRIRREGVYELKFNFGRNLDTGKPLTHYITVAGTEEDADYELSSVRKAKRDGRLDEYLDNIIAGRNESTAKASKSARKARIYMRNHMLDWLIFKAKSPIAATTKATYESNVRVHLTPMFGDVRVRDVNAHKIEMAWNDAYSSGKSLQSIKHLHRTLSQIMKWAIKAEIIEGNPCNHVDKKLYTPPPKPKKMGLTLKQARVVMDVLKDQEIFIPAMIAFLTGMRRGEIIALQWKHIDLNAGKITVEQSAFRAKPPKKSLVQWEDSEGIKAPKGDKCRTVPLPPEMVEILRQHKMEMTELMLKVGVPFSGEAFVYAKPDGSRFKLSTLSHKWGEFRDALDANKITFHGIRHTHANMWIELNMNPKDLQSRLGHSDIRTTMEMYVDEDDERQRIGANAIGATLVTTGRNKA